MNRAVMAGVVMASCALCYSCKSADGASADSSCRVTDLRCEDLVDPIGIDVVKPRLSWRMESAAHGAAQTAYQVLCATSPALFHRGAADLWDSGEVASDQSQHVVYGGKEIARGTPVYWTVRIFDEDGNSSAWAEPAMWTYAGMASETDWQAEWITHSTSSPWLRQTVELQTVPDRATLYINSMGYFQLFINGRLVGADEFTPHVSQLNKRSFCLTYDVTDTLTKGKNAIGLWLGSGWSRGGAGVKLEPAVRAQLEMRDVEGNVATLVTDETWHTKASSLAYRGRWSWGNFGGEVHTGSEDQPDWAAADFDDSGWPTAKLAKVADSIVSSEMLQRSRVVESITPVKVTNLSTTFDASDAVVAKGEKINIRVKKALYGIPGEPAKQVDVGEKLQRLVASNTYRFKMTNAFAGKDPAKWTEKVLMLEYALNGKSISRRIKENAEAALVVVGMPAQGGATTWLVDMGKAMTGTFEITFPKAAKGHKVSMEFGDTYTPGKDGALPKMNSFRQVSEYICRGSGVETFKNRFNYASCRYILIKNAPAGELTPADIKGHFITTDLPIASTFSCSDDTLNAIHGMMEHTLRCLMLGGYQVDCHSRERYGYGGDGQSSLDTTLCLLRSDAFYRKWTRDWLDGQKNDGGLTYTSPASGHGGGPFWCGFLPAATLKHYQHYGELSLVKRNYPAIKKWFELAQSKAVDDLQQQFCGRWYLGDWASPAGVDDKGNAELFIHAYMSYALKQAAQLADALGEADDARTFRDWAAARNTATHKKFYDPESGTYGSGDQVTYILPLIAGVVPEDLHDEILAGFEDTLKVKNKGHLSTGLSGTYLMIQYLQSIGRDD
ncbi:MAG: family 78 glycoside hydrolase catalytic domain, partial [Verrucomicrobia bacterium]|nr:family 78 glycoside hydrolase catalytic domain [Verrucomicrobiota bacterium]